MGKSYVYCWTNRVNGKRYIGKGIEWRATSHLGYAARGSDNCPAFYRAIRKHGPDAFELGYIATGLDDATACRLERACIGMYGTQHEYNITAGGDGLAGYEFSEESKAKMSDTRKAAWEDPERRERQLAGLRSQAPNNPNRSHAIRQLYTHRREAVLAAFDGEMSVRDLAKLTGVSRKCVASTLAEAGWAFELVGRRPTWRKAA